MFEDRELLEKLEQRRGAMTKERSSFISHWKEITQFISPRTARYDKTDRNRGDKQGQDILNETATLALRTLKSGLMAGMSSPARPWFVLGLSDPELADYGPVKEWLDTATRLMRDVFARSNIYSILPKIYSSIGAYGTGAFGIVEDDKEVIRAYMFPVGTFLADCNSRMVVDCLYREYSMTVRQVVSTYGLDNVSSHVKTQYDRGNYGMWVDVVHAIEPHLDRRKGSLESRDKEYISVVYEAGKDRDQALSIKGFDEFPAIVSRWEVNGEDVYGTSCPGMDALGGVKGLQFKERRKYQSMDKIVNSPVNVDATLRNTGADLLPGGINWVPGLSQSANAGIRPIYDISPQIVDMIRNDIAESTQLIRRAFYEDLMLMLAQSDNPQMTAREVDERSQEKLLVLGPLLEQQNDDR